MAVIEGRTGTRKPPSRQAFARRSLGQAGEELAAEYLTAHGFAILARNWRVREGEIDIVARDGDVLVVVEVKTRRSTSHGTPAEAVDARKVARLHRLAWIWRREARPAALNGGTRVDVVAVLMPRDGLASVTHIRGLT